MKLRFDRMVLLIVVFAAAGLIAGYFLFGKVLGRYVSVSALLTGPRNVLEGIGQAVAGIEEIRRNVLISGAVGAAVGLLVSLAPIQMRRGGKRL